MSSSNAPPPNDRAAQLLLSVFGHHEFRAQQRHIVQHIADGGDALVLMPTGGGKSLCYQLPALLRAGTAVVVSPLIALMNDQVAALRQSGVRAAALHSGLSASDAAQDERALQSGELDLLYVAPERLLTERMLSVLDSVPLALFAIDEAHCVSQWGHDFRPEYLQLAQLKDRFAGVPRVALTATADPQTRAEILTRLRLDDARVFIESFDRPNIRYHIVDKHDPRNQLLRFIRDGHEGHCGIVYCLSRRRVDETAAWLTSQGIAALPYHAGMDAAQRNSHQARFQQQDGFVMVATIAFGMGIDKPDVRFVAHLDLPKSMEGYYQETGRAGRDGQPADAWMAYGLGDVVQQRRLIDQSDGTDAFKRVAAQKLDALLGFCEAVDCRRVRLLRYFGEESAACGNCDNCLTPPNTWDGTEAVRLALSCVYRTGQRFGVAYLIDVLRGIDNERVRQWQHHQLALFGLGADHDVNHWRSVFRQLVAVGFATPDHDAYGALKLSDAARPVLRGEQIVQLRRAPPATKAAKKKSSRAGADAAGAPAHTAADAALLTSLKQWRGEQARAQSVPAYVIFHDKTLHAIAALRPRNRDALALVDGIGEKKLERYADAVLELVQAGAR